MYNDPVRHSDLLGDEAGPGPGILQLGEYALNIYRAIRGGENVLDAIKNNSISVSGVLESLQPFGQGGVIKLPANSSPKTVKLTLPPDTYVLMEPADTKTSDKTFDGRHSTKSKSSNEAYRKAKEENGVPRSQQPDRTIKPGTEEGKRARLDNRNIRQDEFTNSKGKKVVIRKDKPVNYPDGGSQGNHYNAGQDPQIPKDLDQHHNY